MPEYQTVAAELRHEPAKTKGSRHIATVAPVPNVEAAEQVIARVRAEMPDATHHAWAYRFAEQFRYSDDGEPSGSAGRPILQQIDGRGLTSVVVVVTRYFGGTKLGVGGLIRAYGGATAAALDHSEILTVVVKRRLLLRHAYELSGTVKGVLAAADLTPIAANYTAEVELEIEVPEDQAEDFLSELRERCAGRIVVE